MSARFLPVTHKGITIGYVRQRDEGGPWATFTTSAQPHGDKRFATRAEAEAFVLARREENERVRTYLLEFSKRQQALVSS